MHIFGGQVVKDFRRRSHEPRAEAQALYRLVAFVASAVMIVMAELQVVGASMVWSQGSRINDEFSGNQCEVPQLCTA